MNPIRIVFCISFFAFFIPAVSGQQDVTVAQERAAVDSSKAPVSGAVATEPVELKLADGQLIFKAPGNWEKVQPRSRILEAEMKVPAAEKNQKDGRITIMRAGGSIPANIARWEGQFTQSDGAVEATTKNEEVAGKQVNFVDITGTFQDSMGRGPFAGGKKVARENYRMSAVIIETGTVGNYFFKFIGPKSVVDPNAEAFKDMIRSMKMEE